MPEEPSGADPLTVGDVGEDRLVADVIRRYPGADWLRVGPGDDAAVLDLGGPVVIGTDTLVEGLDFRRDWSSARDVGVKVAAQNFADLAAMGAHPRALLVSLVIPAGMPAAWAGELAEGLAQECARAGAVVVGGDLSAGTELVVTGTALGTLATDRAVTRAGARPGDAVALAGRPGRSGAGLALLRAGADGSDLEAVSRLIGEHRRPQPPYPAGPEAAAAGATAMIDTSDGLLRDATRVARASGVVLDLDHLALPQDADLLAAAVVLAQPDPFGWILNGGEDHALLATFPAGAAIPAAFHRIGTVRAGDEPPVLLSGAAPPPDTGWRHFA